MILIEHKLLSNLQPHPSLGMSGMMDHSLALELKRSANGAADKKLVHAERAEALKLKIDGLSEDIKKNGLLEPLKICIENKKWLIVDGRHRWMAAKALGLNKLPCIVVSASKAKETMLSAMQGKHLSKSARAYTAVTIYPEVALDGKARFEAGKKTEPSALSAGGLATKIGVGLRTVETACALYRIFHEHPYLKKNYEQGVFTCQSIAHVKGDMQQRVKHHEEHGTYEYKQPDKLKGEAKKEQTLIERKALVKNGFSAMRLHNEQIISGWDLLDEEDIQTVEETFKAFLDELPDQVKALAKKHLED